MSKRVQVLAGLLCLLVLCCACSAPIIAPTSVTPGPSQQQEKLLSDVRTQYRNASLVISGVCEGDHIDATGATCYDIRVTEVHAGNANVGDLVHCRSHAMQEGESYLLFLNEGEDVHYAEDTLEFSLLSDEPLPILDGNVVLNGQRLDLKTFNEEISRLSNVIHAPAPIYFYNSLEELVDAADEIFIGRVRDLTATADYTFSVRNGGSVEKAQYEASLATIEAYGSIKGVLRYGEQIELVHCPSRIGGMQDAATLQLKGYTKDDALHLEKDGLYVFFLINGPDKKQNYLFPLNPLQGYIELSGETLYVDVKNAPLRPYQNLTALVNELKSALRKATPVQDNPPLIIEE